MRNLFHNVISGLRWPLSFLPYDGNKTVSGAVGTVLLSTLYALIQALEGNNPDLVSAIQSVAILLEKFGAEPVVNVVLLGAMGSAIYSAIGAIDKVLKAARDATAPKRPTE